MKKLFLFAAILTLSACASVTDPDERMELTGHMNEPAPAPSATAADIPPVVQQVPIIAAPEPVEPLQTFTVVATDLPASELLFALARDARLNLDIDPSIDGRVSINAIDQTLPQILKRISRQVTLRYYLDGPNLVVEVDRPFLRIYNVDYLNMSRSTTTDVGIETELGATADDGGGTGDSSAAITSESENQFWRTLEDNIDLMAKAGGAEGIVISNRETGTVSVQTTSVNHENIQRFLDTVLASARRQVLIEATVVEVTLDDDFQAGVDWARVAQGDGWSVSQQLLGAGAGTPGTPSLGTPSITSATYLNTNSDRTISSAIQALDTFGDVSVMSSPKIMALNNQTSILKVADNIVYFEVESTGATATDAGIIAGVTNTTPKTVPVGFVMNVTPFISAENEVTLNIRPTITRVVGFVDDPNPELTIPNRIPEIQVRELESVMRVSSGNTAVIGGLMQDSIDAQSSGLPGLHDMKGVGVLFGNKTRNSDKTELVIFLRPRVIDNASLETNLQDFKKYLQPESFSSN